MTHNQYTVYIYIYISSNVTLVGFALVSCCVYPSKHPMALQRTPDVLPHQKCGLNEWVITYHWVINNVGLKKIRSRVDKNDVPINYHWFINYRRLVRHRSFFFYGFYYRHHRCLEALGCQDFSSDFANKA